LNYWTIICYPFSQLCKISYNYLFTDKGVTILWNSDGSFVFKGVLRAKLYLMNFIPKWNLIGA
jgi:hypothetical protein